MIIFLLLFTLLLSPIYSKDILLHSEPIMLVAYTKEVMYVKLDTNTIRTLIYTSDDEELRQIYGDKLPQDLLHFDYCIEGFDLWNQKKKIFLIRNEDLRQEIFVVEDAWFYDDFCIVNPLPKENPDEYFITWKDNTTCPLKILAYRIRIDEYDNVLVDLVVKNTSKKEIVGLRGKMFMYDKMGHPVTWGGGDNIFGFMSQEVNIPPNSEPLLIGYWKLTLFEKTRRIKPYITELMFEDGTFWKAEKNPIKK